MDQQFLHEIVYKKLKNVRNVTVNFEGNKITGIFGVNGSGKSTILHSLLCLYKPSEKDVNRKNYKFSNFFTPTTHSSWAGSEIIAKMSYRHGKTVNKIEKIYSKTSDRWKPQYDRRPDRDVYYLGIDSCVPDIEKETYSSLISFDTKNLTDKDSQKILNNTAIVLNKKIDELYIYSRKKREYFGFSESSMKYSSLFMGSGEQRILRMMTIIIKCPKYSLIVIDEIELTLHSLALQKLIDIFNRIADEKNLQIIFTSHREELLKRTDINIRHIHQSIDKTIIFNNTTLDCITRLNGEVQKKIELFVEDEVSKKLISKLIYEKNINKYCSIKTYGSIDNAFSLLAGLFLKGDDLSNTLIITDGDKYKSKEEKLVQLKKHLTGNEPEKEQIREDLLVNLCEYLLDEDCNPEKHIFNSLRELNDGSQICECSIGINIVQDNHDYLRELVDMLGFEEKSEGLVRIVDKYYDCKEFNIMVQNISAWIDAKKKELSLCT